MHPHIFKTATISLIVICFHQIANCQNYNINDIRGIFFELTKNSRRADTVLTQLQSLEEPQPLIFAYISSAQAYLAKNSGNPFSKFSYLNKSRNSMKKAVEGDPQNLEIRFLRFAIESQIPTFLGYSKHVSADKSFILDNLTDFKMPHLDMEVYSYILRFMTSSKKMSEEEVNYIKSVLLH